MKVLVVGGAGYIGSHMVKMLLAASHQVVTLDNLCNGHRDAVVGGEFVEGDLGDRGLLDTLMNQHSFDCVVHFASFIAVGESVVEPAEYYQNNVAATLNLLDAMVSHGVKELVFSSTAAVYGEPEYSPIDEAHPTTPINPYGRSKLMVEQILQDYDRAYALKSISLRYFNAAGADPGHQLGERHQPETHLIPLVLQAASGRHKSIQLYGRDYATDDGTCIRDYVHVVDLCSAHLLALDWLKAGKGSGVYNLGNGNGYSVQQLIDAAVRVTGREIQIEDCPARDGDAAILVADASRAITELGWQPEFSALDTIIEHAWQWELHHWKA
ncbi:UDP-glucose 4-epimerase GalE [Solemya pervernicosa gill symbiont]|uniref:UDP-glucose 4-epimerase n=2 Tax=Gammaproteobacteria incertae sedis TaxID=118884 RepID=A0A1T2L0G8_9GAMM|nr:UDP-glucose 4-epimerase GalE [Candidatus Reidiella endopervernicosa]OOZ38578.1 UDP-glucose 4-epimerase GalE [Solemya pervernicosa gill symbiont]QKQ26949.1 UDP-glucose 4-epimerase GalE [Candidatus Reidiella endopervernicosa]